LEILQAYLEIMSIRLAGRATFSVDVDSDCIHAAVPTLVLQPLVENAYRHGIERKKRDGILRIAAHRKGESLEVLIVDNGAGLNGDKMREGFGLRIVRERLAELYGERASIKLFTDDQGYTVSELRLPFRTIASADRTSHTDMHTLEYAR
jgi:LytS/YehU family sensor histidine kinase